MSLILEALKKSESKRRLGETPNLGTPLMHTPRRRNFLPFLLLMMIIAAGVGWWFFQAPGVSVTTPQKITDPAAQSPKTPAVASAPLAAIKPSAPTASPSAITSSPPPHPVKPTANVAPATQSPASTPNSNPATAPTATTAPAAVPSVPVSSTPPPPAAITATPPPPASSANSPATPAPPTPNAASVTPTTGQSPPAASNSPSALPVYYQLAYALRKDLPPIKISMHVFTAEPAQRFVMINGTRQVEGDKLGTDLILSEIRPTEIVLEFRNQRFIVPRSGM